MRLSAKPKQPEKRLHSLWGYIDRQHNTLIASKLEPGSVILDVGCGYGSLVHSLKMWGYHARGIDIDPKSVEAARRLYPDIDVSLADVESLGSETHHVFDAIVLKDTLHHIVGEHDPYHTCQIFRRLLKEDGQLIILDPNPTWLLRAMRFLIRHQDPEVSVDVALRLLHEMNFIVQQVEYYEVIGLPLSGGYVGYRFVPNVRFINRSIAGLNAVLSKAIQRVRWGPMVCLRYLIQAKVQSHG